MMMSTGMSKTLAGLPAAVSTTVSISGKNDVQWDGAGHDRTIVALRGEWERNR